MKNIFTKHPHSIGETYFKHALEALFIAVRMTYTSIAMIIHAVFPFLFVKTARKTVYYFYERFERRLAPLQEKQKLSEMVLEEIEVETSKLES